MRQDNFGGGEIAPALRSRTDIQLYERALSLSRNALITPEGQFTNRPGFQFVREVKNSADTAHKLIPFIFGGGQDYMMLFGPSYIWFLQGGAVVMNGGNPLEVVTTYTAGDVPFLKTSQSGDQVIITVANKPPRVLSRIAALNWSIADYVIGTTLAAPVSLAFTSTPSAADAQHAGKAWDIVVTAYSGGDMPEESLPSNVISITSGQALYPDKSAFYQWGAVTGAVGYFLYRGQPNQRFGYIGTSKTNNFRDEGQVPLYAEPPPAGKNPFTGGTQFNPQVNAFHALRLWFANSLPAPSTVWSSRIAALKSFDAAEPPRDDDAIIATLATRKYDEIRSMLSLGGYLYLMGSGAEWLLSGVPQGAPPTPANSPAIPVSYWGASWLDPIVIGEVPLFVTDQESHVRELIVGQTVDSSRDLSLLASHLFKGHSLVDWAFARTPFCTIFQAREDGKLLGLSYIRQLQQTAWSQHDTVGNFENVGTIPGVGEDDVYVIVKRSVNGSIKRYIERAATRQIDHARKGVFLDSSVYYNGINATATTIKATGVYTAGGAVTLLASAALFAGADVNDEIVFAPAKSGGDIRIRITAFTDTTHVTAQVVTAIPVAYQDVATTDWGFGRKGFGSLNHLQAETIDVLADGVPLVSPADFTFAGTTVTLTVPAVLVVIGRHYDTDMGLLDVRDEDGKQKIVSTVVFEVVDSSGVGLKAGQSLLGLTDFQAEDGVVTDYRGYLTDATAPDAPVRVRVGIEGSWNRHGAAYLRQSKPLPLTVNAVNREVSVVNADP